MKIRPLIIDLPAKKEIRRVREYAERPEHIYDMSNAAVIPGNDPCFVCHISSYRCVFSHTLDFDRRLFRHLTVSVPEDGKLPNPIAVFTLAALFGFTGYELSMGMKFPDVWQVAHIKADHCIAIAQEMVPTTISPIAS